MQTIIVSGCHFTSVTNTCLGLYLAPLLVSPKKQHTDSTGAKRRGAPKEADAMLMVPLDDAGECARVLKGQAADVGQPLVQKGLLDAVSVRENGRLLLSQVHVQATVPAP